MDHSHTTASPDRAWAAPEPQPAAERDDLRRVSCLTRGQRWLAGATAIAVLLSGLNASLQVWKVLAEHHGPPARPHHSASELRKPSARTGAPAWTPNSRASRTE